MNVKAASPGRGNVSRRSFHDDISVIVVFLEKPSILRKRLLNMSYTGSSPTPQPSDFAGSELSSLIRTPLSPRGLKAGLRRRSRSVDSPRVRESPLGGSSQGEDTDRLIDDKARRTALGHWASLREKLLAKFRRKS